MDSWTAGIETIELGHNWKEIETLNFQKKSYLIIVHPSKNKINF